MTDDFYPCVIEKSPINGNFTLWLPEQEGLIEWVEEKYGGSQGYLWHELIRAASEIKNIDIASAYIEPEGDVFVAYSRDVRVLEKMANLIKELILRKALFLKMVERAESQGYLK